MSLDLDFAPSDQGLAPLHKTRTRVRVRVKNKIKIRSRVRARVKARVKHRPVSTLRIDAK